MLLEAWEFVQRRPDLLLGWVTSHIWITLVAIIVAVILGVSIGIFITGRGREHLADSILYLAEIMMTIPSLALFGLLILLLSSIGLKSFGFYPTVIALVLYGQLPILRNTYTAIKSVDPAMVEAGRGMGMTDSQIIFKIQIPLALPIIMAGVRNAVVLIIGIATIAAAIGAKGLGEPIWRGIRNAEAYRILVGGISVALLAVFADGLMALLERFIVPKGLKSGKKA
ncbi:MAG: ABC transporter permease [Dehalococcoidales bacterium]|nr:ABC transporter permease [Dehalococcoidales bacterium]